MNSDAIKAIESSASLGMAQDIIILVELFDQLGASAKRDLLAKAVTALATRWASLLKSPDGKPTTVDDWFVLLHGRLPPWDRATSLSARIGRSAPIQSGGHTRDILDLISLYAQGDKPGLLSAAAEAVAAKRIGDLNCPTEDSVDVKSWLTGIADDTFPTSVECDAAALIIQMTDASGWSRNELFQEGVLGTLLSPASEEGVLGAGVHSSYSYLRSTLDIMSMPPDPAEYFATRVSQDDYRVQDDDGNLVPDLERWQQDVSAQCDGEFVALVAQWRMNFFQAVISGQRPSNTKKSSNKVEPRELSDFTDDELEQLIDDALASIPRSVEGRTASDEN